MCVLQESTAASALRAAATLWAAACCHSARGAQPGASAVWDWASEGTRGDSVRVARGVGHTDGGELSLPTPRIAAQRRPVGPQGPHMSLWERLWALLGLGDSGEHLGLIWGSDGP